MLALSFNHRFCFKYIIKIFCLIFFITSSLSAYEFDEGEWLDEYFQSINEDTSLEEVIDLIEDIRLYAINQGYQVEPLYKIFLEYKEFLISKGMPIADEDLENIYEMILEKEPTNLHEISNKLCIPHYRNNIIQIGNKNKKSDIKISGKMAVGFLKFMAGGLCCIIPNPAAKAFGMTLAGNGLNDMLDGAREIGDKNQKRSNSI